MTQYDDSHLVDYLFDEMSEEDARAFEQAMSEDAALSAEVDALSETLGVMRELEDAEPPPHLDALILATARQTAEAVQAEREEASWLGRLRKMLLTPAFGLAAAASLAVVVMVSVGIGSFVSAPQEASEAVPPGFASAENESAARPAATPAPDDDLVEAEDEGFALDDLKAGKRKAEEKPLDLAQPSPAPPKPRSTVRRRARSAPPPPEPIEEKSKLARASEGAGAGDSLFDAKDATSARAAKVPSTSASSGRMGDRRDDTSTPRSVTEAPAVGSVAQAPTMDSALEAPRQAPTGGAAAGPQRQAATKSDMAAELDVAKPRVTREVAKKSRTIVSADAPAPAPAPKTAPRPEPAPAEAMAEEADKESRAQARSGRLMDGDDAVSKHREAATLAATMVRAAEQEIARKEYDSARRIFGRAVQRVQGTPSEGEVLLRWAYFERDQRRYSVCVSLADRASRVPGFNRRSEAERLVQDASRRMEPEMAPAAPASTPPRR